MTVYDIEANKLIEKTADELRKIDELKMPDWARFVKTGVFKERPPLNNDWWYLRQASMLRKIYLKGPIGVEKLKTDYGGRKNRGYKPEKFFKGSGKIIRIVLQQLEKIELIKKAEKGVYKGRIITAKGKSFLDKLAKAK